MNCGPPDQLAPCFLDLNWGDSMGSIVSPAAADSAIPAESLAVGELIGRLGSICNPGEIFPQSHYMGAPLNSPPKLHLSMMGHHHQQQQDCRGLPVSENPVNLAAFTTDPGFVERAARFSCFGGGGRNYGGVTGQFGLPETGKLSRISSCQSLKAKGSHKGSGEFGNAREESSASDPISASEGNARKRKAVPKGKGKDPAISPPAKDSSKTAEGEDSTAKRSRSADNTKPENDEFDPTIEQNGGVSSSGDDEQKQGKENNAKPPEPSKQDYIHVRARRGQATDSHSLAERVRREKISERMKLLQDLVPGCNKVNGKALMLDEIINYVQSLQRQVEFLSMKLATVNPRLDFDMENLLSKDIHQASENLSNLVYPLENSATAFSYAHQPQQCVVTNGIETQCTMNPLEHALHRTLIMQLPAIGGFGDANSQLGTFWEDDLQNVVQMGFGQSQEMAFSSQGFHDPLPDAHTKIEL